MGVCKLTALISPTINLNGNSRDDLFEKARGISRALQGVLDAMQRGTDLVHGRNHQDMDAREAYGERAAAIHAMLKEFNRMAIDIMGEGD